jgi:predicted  nucleic acid-binding Zn-ribbon protein
MNEEVEKWGHEDDPGHIMNAITDLQNNIVSQREAKADLERQLADIAQQIDDDLQAVSELSERLQAAIASKTHKAVGG